jgi:hypothetical protein
MQWHGQLRRCVHEVGGLLRNNVQFRILQKRQFVRPVRRTERMDAGKQRRIGRQHAYQDEQQWR